MIIISVSINLLMVITMYKPILLFIITFMPALSIAADTGMRQLLQMVDYVGVDYGEAVQGGKIVNQAEYDEMQEFAVAILSHTEHLPTGDAALLLQQQAKVLAKQVAQRDDPGEILHTTMQMRQQLIGGFGLVVTPFRPPALAHAEQLYSTHCVSCHGSEGWGDGPLSGSVVPAPTNFRDRQRYLQRTLLGLYNTITYGVEGTAMKPFSGLTTHERWSLAFYTGTLAADKAERELGETLWEGDRKDMPLANLATLTTWTPGEAQQQLGDEGLALMAFLRSQPEVLMAQREAPMSYSQRRLLESLELAQQGDLIQAHKVSVDAYLEGFELAENSLNSVDSQLRRTIESAMTDYRSKLYNQAPLPELESLAERTVALLGQAQARLDSTTLSHEAAFSGAFIILLREGLEALLVLAALAAFLIKTGRRDGLPYLYGGVLLAMALGGVTWLASVTVIDISGAQRELTEGFAALFAATVLFYVGFWLHGKSSAYHWRRFIEGSIQKALSRGTLWGLAGLSFLAVYREIFETILFYQALWMQTDQAGQGMILSGLVTASALLVVLAWLILRYSTRLPLRQFFAVTGVFMFLLAMVFAGKGVAALQEAGRVTLNPVAFPRIDLLGIYPNLEGLAVQAVMLLLALGLLFSDRLLKRPLRAKSGD
jgi:high-affinity iron transporter